MAIYSPPRRGVGQASIRGVPPWSLVERKSKRKIDHHGAGREHANVHAEALPIGRALYQAEQRLSRGARGGGGGGGGVGGVYRGSTPNRRIVLTQGAGLGHMGERHPLELVQSLMLRPAQMYKACKGSKLTMSNVKKAYTWVTQDGRTLNYSYKKGEENRLPTAHREMPACTVAGLRTGHVTPRLQAMAPRGSEDRCLTLVFEDKTCLSYIFNNAEEMRACRAATGLVALVAHAATTFSTEERAERLLALGGVQLPAAVLASESSLDKALLASRCNCAVQCGGKFCQEMLAQLKQHAQANAEQARRLDGKKRAERGRELIAQLQAKLHASKRSGAGAGEDDRAALQRELVAAEEYVRRAQETLAALPKLAGAASDEAAPALPARQADLERGQQPNFLDAASNSLLALVADLRSPDPQTAAAAVEALKDATEPKDSADVRSQVVAAGAVEALCELLIGEDPVVATHAARTVAHVARAKAHHEHIGAAGGLQRLLALLHFGVRTRNASGDAAAAAAAMALVNLCSGNDSTRAWVVQCGGMQLLMLDGAHEPGDEALGNALALYRSLVSTWTPEDAYSLDDAEHTVAALVDFVSQSEGCDESGRSHPVNAAWVLSSLARAAPRFQDLVRQAGGLPPLVRMLQSPDVRAVAAAVAALSNLVSGSTPNQHAVRAAGVLATLQRVLAEYPGQPVARNATKAIQALAGVLGDGPRRALRELEATAKAVCTPEQRLGLWLRLELKMWLSARLQD